MLSNGTLFVGLPLNRGVKRSLIPHYGLRHTTAAAIIRMLKGGTVLDPVCGVGVLLCELAIRMDSQLLCVEDSCRKNGRPCLVLIGSDFSMEQLVRAQDNLLYTESQLNRSSLYWDLVCCSAENLPFRSGVFDSLVCDLPFGHKHGVASQSSLTFDPEKLEELYGALIQRIPRILVPHGQFALLAGQTLTDFTRKSLLASQCHVNSMDSVSLGLTSATLFRGYFESPG